MKNTILLVLAFFAALIIWVLINPGIIVEWMYILQTYVFTPETGVCVASANFLSDRGEFRNNAAWHNAGNVFTGEQTLVEAAAKHWADIKIHKLKVYSPYPFTTDKDGNALDSGFDVRPIEVSDKYNIFRAPIIEDPQPLYLGTVNKSWETKNPSWYAEKLNDLSLQYPLETLGTLGMGERVFFSLKQNPVVASNGKGYSEDILSHFVFDLSLKPGVSSKAFTTKTRPVCANTLHIGWNDASHRMKMPHTMKADEMFRWLITVTEFGAKENEFQREVLCSFMETHMRIDGEHFQTYLESVYQLPAVPQRVERFRKMSPAQRAQLSDKQKEAIEKDERRFVVSSERTDLLRSQVRELAEQFNDEFPQVANTAYAAYNAVTEYATHRTPTSTREDVARSVLNGARADEIGAAADQLVKFCKGEFHGVSSN